MRYLLTGLGCGTAGLTTGEAATAPRRDRPQRPPSQRPERTSPPAAPAAHPPARAAAVAGRRPGLRHQGATLGIAIVGRDRAQRRLRVRPGAARRARRRRTQPLPARRTRPSSGTAPRPSWTPADSCPATCSSSQEGDAVCADARIARRRRRGRPVGDHRRVGAGRPARPEDRGAEPRRRSSTPRTSSSPARRAPAARRGRWSSRPAWRPSSAGSRRSRSRTCAARPSPLERQVRRVAWLIAAVAVLVGRRVPPARRCSPGCASRGRRLRDRPAGRQRAGGTAADDHPRAGRRRARARAARRPGQAAERGRDARLDRRDLHRQDRHADREPHARAQHLGRDRRPSPAAAATPRPRPSRCGTCTTADLEAGTGDPTELALLERGRPARPRTSRTRPARAAGDVPLRPAAAAHDDGRRPPTADGRSPAPRAHPRRCCAAVTHVRPATAGRAARPRRARPLLEPAGRAAPAQGLRLIACAGASAATGRRPTARTPSASLPSSASSPCSTPRDAVPDAVAQAPRGRDPRQRGHRRQRATAAAIARRAGIGAERRLRGRDRARSSTRMTDAAARRAARRRGTRSSSPAARPRPSCGSPTRCRPPVTSSP